VLEKREKKLLVIGLALKNEFMKRIVWKLRLRYGLQNDPSGVQVELQKPNKFANGDARLADNAKPGSPLLQLLSNEVKLSGSLEMNAELKAVQIASQKTKIALL
jgi:hypothetical protein